MDIIAAEDVLHDNAGHVVRCLHMGEGIKIASVTLFTLKGSGVEIIAIE